MVNNQYIITICDEIVNANYARSLVEIALKCRKSKRYFSDLKKNKAQFSSSFLDELEENYPIINRNYAYTGVGLPLKETTNAIQNNEKGVFIPYENLTSFILSQQRMLDINDITTKFVVSFRDFIENEPRIVGGFKDKVVYSDRGTKKGGRAVSFYLSHLRHIHNLARREYNDTEVGDIKIPREPFKNGIILPRCSGSSSIWVNGL